MTSPLRLQTASRTTTPRVARALRLHRDPAEGPGLLSTYGFVLMNAVATRSGHGALQAVEADPEYPYVTMARPGLTPWARHVRRARDARCSSSTGDHGAEGGTSPSRCAESEDLRTSSRACSISCWRCSSCLRPRRSRQDVPRPAGGSGGSAQRVTFVGRPSRRDDAHRGDSSSCSTSSPRSG